MRTMSDRTDPVDVLERIGWYLAYHEGEEISTHELAEATDMSWATAHRYVQTLTRMQQVMPDIDMDGSSIEILDQTQEIKDLNKDPAVTACVYLFNQSVIHDNDPDREYGTPTTLVYEEDNEHFFEQFDEALDNAEELGWVKRGDAGAQLTPKGVQVAGPTKSKLENQPFIN